MAAYDQAPRSSCITCEMDRRGKGKWRVLKSTNNAVEQHHQASCQPTLVPTSTEVQTTITHHGAYEVVHRGYPRPEEDEAVCAE
jgi:hypothetical protein